MTRNRTTERTPQTKLSATIHWPASLLKLLLEITQLLNSKNPLLTTPKSFPKPLKIWTKLPEITTKQLKASKLTTTKELKLTINGLPLTLNSQTPSSQSTKPQN
jgi:hypothetical protein